jgi:hypothetical protein
MLFWVGLLLVFVIVTAVMTVVSIFTPALDPVQRLIDRGSELATAALERAREFARSVSPAEQVAWLGGVCLLGILLVERTADLTSWWAHGESPFSRLAAFVVGLTSKGGFRARAQREQQHQKREQQHPQRRLHPDQEETSLSRIERDATEFLSGPAAGFLLALALFLPRFFFALFMLAYDIACKSRNHRLILSVVVAPTLIAGGWWIGFDICREFFGPEFVDSLTAGWAEPIETPAGERQRVAWVTILTLATMWLAFMLVLPQFGPRALRFIAPERNLAVWLSGTAKTPKMLLAAVTMAAFCALVLTGVAVDGDQAKPAKGSGAEDAISPPPPGAQMGTTLFACLCAAAALFMFREAMP